MLTGTLLFFLALSVPAHAVSTTLDFEKYLKLVTGFTVKMTLVESDSREIPSWFGVAYDVTDAENAYPAFALAECFQGLPCYKVEFLPNWSWLAGLLKKVNVELPSIYAADLIPEMSAYYLQSHCGKQPVREFSKEWNVQISAGDTATSYNISDIYCTGVKTDEGANGPYVSEVTFNLGKIESYISQSPEQE